MNAVEQIRLINDAKQLLRHEHEKVCRDVWERARIDILNRLIAEVEELWNAAESIFESEDVRIKRGR